MSIGHSPRTSKDIYFFVIDYERPAAELIGGWFPSPMAVLDVCADVHLTGMHRPARSELQPARTWMARPGSGPTLVLGSAGSHRRVADCAGLLRRGARIPWGRIVPADAARLQTIGLGESSPQNLNMRAAFQGRSSSIYQPCRSVKRSGGFKSASSDATPRTTTLTSWRERPRAGPARRSSKRSSTLCMTDSAGGKNRRI